MALQTEPARRPRPAALSAGWVLAVLVSPPALACLLAAIAPPDPLNAAERLTYLMIGLAPFATAATGFVVARRRGGSGTLAVPAGFIAGNLMLLVLLFAVALSFGIATTAD